MTAFPIADHWFERTTIDDSITLLWEPHVIPLMRCNIWHVRGRDRDLVVDTGMGLMSLSDELADLVDKDVTAVATHGHDDHIGGHHEFDTCWCIRWRHRCCWTHRSTSLVPREAWGDDVVDALEAAGYPMPEPYFVTALPAGMALDSFHQEPVARVRHIDEGDEIDLGDRCFAGDPPSRPLSRIDRTVGAANRHPVLRRCDLRRPAARRTAGIVDRRLLPTMDRLMSLPVTVVHAGHDPSFGRDGCGSWPRPTCDAAESEPNCLPQVACQAPASAV